MILEEQLNSSNGQKDPLWAGEESSIVKMINEEISKVRKYSPEKAKTLTNAFLMLLSVSNREKFFSQKAMGKQVIRFLADIQHTENPIKIVNAYLDLHQKNNLDITTVYFFNEMIRNNMRIDSAKAMILNINEYSHPQCAPKTKERIGKILSEAPLPRLLEDVNAYIADREVFNKKVEVAIEKNRKRGQLHFITLKGDSFDRGASDQYLNYDYGRPLPGVNFQDIDGKTPLHYAIERAAESYTKAQTFTSYQGEGLTLIHSFRVANKILANELGYTTAAVKDDAGKTPRDLVEGIENEKVKERFREFFEVADKRQIVLQACKKICSDLDKKSWGGQEKKEKIQGLMKKLQNVTTKESYETYLMLLKIECKQRRVFNFHFFESMREEAQSFRTLMHALEPDRSLLSREDAESKKKSPGNKLGGS
jgi:hypothetical protein